jgi:hypothetical protein
MRWSSKAMKDPFFWHPWFAWFPVRLPYDHFKPGQWVWGEWIWRSVISTYAGASAIYSLEKPKEEHP